MADYYIGQIFIEKYPADAATWCNDNNASIAPIEPENNKKRFQIQAQEPYVPTQEEIDRLTMTALDFIGVLQTFGLTLPEINEFLESNLNIKMQLTYCNNVFCGVAKSFLPITVKGITITPAMVEQAFKIKNGVA
jgi:hypothetical protein